MSSLHERAKELFLAALDQPVDERGVFVAEGCGGDVALRREVESLLAFHDEDPSWHKTPVSREAVAEPEKESFAPGDVFAGRYRMITRIGRGGMGDVWQADDLVLDTPVALKLIHLAGPDARLRILNEVRLARRITHPAVCRVFDVGEADGQVFFTMELVQGENLATLLKRVGRLPSEKVIEIAHQLCAGLAMAHTQRVLHRDLKPANVLIDDDGHVRITDFGIAVTRTQDGRHTLVGTPGYMAPEQLSSEGSLSERTDVYALGLLLYELLVGQHPFNRAAAPNRLPPPRPSTLVPDVNPQLEQVILQAISHDPSDRPASASAIAARLPRSASGRTGRRLTRPWMAAAVVAALAGILAVATPLLLPRGARALTEQDTIVLADFVNTTGEPVFDGALKVALAVALEQSPFIKVFPDQRVQETLRLMKRPPEEPLTRSLAREVAQREQLKALFTGSIGRFGSNYALSLEAVNAETGDVMAREQVEVPGKEQVLTALGTATAKLREKLGESLGSIKRFDTPLPRATTPSLEALHAYSLALDEGRVVPRLEAIPHLQRAIEIDPNFVMAQALLSGIYWNNGRSALAPEFSRRAFELRDRVSERERFFVSWRYYLDVAQAWDKALELAASWTTTYPREAFAFNSLGIASGAFGDHAKGVEALREAIRLDPRFSTPYGNLAGALLALNRFDEARAIVQQADERGFNLVGVRRTAYWLAFILGDTRSMAGELNRAAESPEAVEASNLEARATAFSGRYQVAHELYGRAVQAALQGNFKEFAALWTMQDAVVHAIAGECGETRREVAQGLEFSRDNYTLERAGRALAWCGAGQEVASLSSELATRFPSSTLRVRIHVPVLNATLALRRDDPVRVLELLDPVKPYDFAPASEYWPQYLRGQAYLLLKDGSLAGAQFQGIVNRRGVEPASPLYPLAYLGLGRALAMTGDVAKARQAYEDFFTLWKDADADLLVLKEARHEFARLQ